MDFTKRQKAFLTDFVPNYYILQVFCMNICIFLHVNYCLIVIFLMTGDIR